MPVNKNGLLFLLLVSSLFLSSNGVDLHGAGASFPAGVYASWMSHFEAYRSRFVSINMRYEAIGSGGGKSRIKGESEPAVDYAGSDSLLSDTDYENHPDLQMFPSMAGPIVMAFNLPGVTSINLKMEHIGLIYSGDIVWWNDTRLTSMNPDVLMPHHQIVPMARREKSGSTEIFTTALTASSSAWAAAYGSFNKGLDSNDQPYKWNASVVKLFGQTGRGVSGLILSVKYSIGYLVLSDAKNAKVTYAKLANRAGNIVEASPATVQNAMSDFTDDFNERMTISLANPKGPFSYPISGYTYIIVRKTTMDDCLSAMELVRYIEWFFTQDEPRKDAETLHMVPLSKSVYTLVLQNIVRRMTCGGRLVYELVLEQIEEENIAMQTWRTPLYIIIPILCLSFILLGMYFVRNQILIHRELLRGEWLIPNKDIQLGFGQKFVSVIDLNRSRLSNKISPSVGTFNSDHSISITTNVKRGRWNGKHVHIETCSWFSSKKKPSIKTRRTLLWLRNKINHKNTKLFYGVTDYGDSTYDMVSELCQKGTVHDLVHNLTITVTKEMKYCISLDIAKGMLYLHKKGLVHGCLTSKCCYLDASYTVKIGGWQEHHLAEHLNQNIISNEIYSANDWEMPELWTAPELLRGIVSPSEITDVFSFAIVMQEVFSRDLPYSEHVDSQEPNDILQAVISTSLRPVFTPDTPVASREIMERAWEMDPYARPSFSTIYALLSNSFNKSTTLMDCMMNTLEEYTLELEAKLREVKMFEPGVKQRPSTVEYPALPSELTSTFDMEAEPCPERFDSASIMVCVIDGFADFVAKAQPSEVAALLNRWYTVLENALAENNVNRYDILADTYMLVAGLPTRRGDHAVIIGRAALNFLVLAKSFSIGDSGTTLQLRIGLCSGSGMAGVLYPKYLVKYSVFGRTADCARVLADTTPPMTIHVAESTATHLSSKDFKMIPAQPSRDLSEVKKSYWLIGSRQISSTFAPG